MRPWCMTGEADVSQPKEPCSRKVAYRMRYFEATSGYTVSMTFRFT